MFIFEIHLASLWLVNVLDVNRHINLLLMYLFITLRCRNSKRNVLTDLSLRYFNCGWSVQIGTMVGIILNFQTPILVLETYLCPNPNIVCWSTEKNCSKIRLKLVSLKKTQIKIGLPFIKNSVQGIRSHMVQKWSQRNGLSVPANNEFSNLFCFAILVGRDWDGLISSAAFFQRTEPCREHVYLRSAQNT